MVKTKRKFPTLTAKQAAYWMSEAWGRPVAAKDVRVRNSWVFVLDRDFPDEVDALFAPHGSDLHGEPWDGIRFEQSPFVVKDKQAVKKLTDKLSEEYRKYLIACGWETEDVDELITPDNNKPPQKDRTQ